ncbi:hypothetical protein ANO11243_003700 [Dothideomycetidae sp. 11243]|nr:hypothetical protein ANO11243_003700 [fungal sp. No.11243]
MRHRRRGCVGHGALEPLKVVPLQPFAEGSGPLDLAPALAPALAPVCNELHLCRTSQSLHRLLHVRRCSGIHPEPWEQRHLD